jgi:hypothetical protein
MVKTKSGMKAFPYTSKGKMEAKEYAKELIERARKGA